MSQLANHTDRFARSVQRFARCCVRMEDEFRRGRLKVTDIEMVYCSCFLNVSSRWETYLEEVLIRAVCGPKSNNSENWRFAWFRTRECLKNILTHRGKPYLGFTTIEEAEKLSSLLVNKGRPISVVSSNNRTLIGQAVQIRNAIAHDSGMAKKNFKEKVPGVSALPNSKRTPGAFLRHEFRQYPSQRRYEIYFVAFQMAAEEISKAW